jgi:cyanophycinase
MAIGGHERKEGEMEILRTFVELARPKPIVVATLASEVSGEIWSEYRRAFHALGAKDIVHLRIGERTQAADEPAVKDVKKAGGVFFTGGDQLRLTSKLGGTTLCQTIQDLYRSGVVIAGTSAGASVLTETMIVSGAAEQSHQVGDFSHLAPGLGFLTGIVIDQHFAERGRVGRLLGVVAQNPRALGIGIDENTAVVVENGRRLRVIGTGAVYVVDGRSITATNASEEDAGQTLSVFDVKLHLLSKGDLFDLEERRPSRDDAASGHNDKQKESRPAARTH